MKLVKKIINDKISINIPPQANLLVKEIWIDEVYNKLYKIQKGDIVLDIGANVGAFSIYAAAKGAKVFCFEPNPEIFEVLQVNIKANNLEAQIIPLNMALGGENGIIDLFVANSDKIYAEGSGSINKDYIRDLGDKIGDSFKKYSVTCSKLEDILNQLKIENVNFVKLDCEGAEFDIIKSTPASILKNIPNIAMETHTSCYSEKAICQMLGGKGYIIHDLVTTPDLYKIGFLYCSQNATTPVFEPLFKPLALFSSPPYVIANGTAEFDGSNSFATNIPDDMLQYTWRINDEVLRDNGNKLCYQFKTPGVYKVGFEISFNDMRGFSEKEILVLKADYFSKKIDFTLGKPSRLFPFKINSPKTFSIIQSVFGKVNAGKVFLGIVKDNLSPIQLEFNGRIITINNHHIEIELGKMPFSFDIIFTLSQGEPFTSEADLKVEWWFEPENEKALQKSMEIQEGTATASMPLLGEESFYMFSGEKTFSISNDKLPSPDIKVSITPVPFQGKKRILSGFLNYLNNKFKIFDWHCEVKLHEIDINRDLNFKINLPDKNCIKVVWWGE